MKCNVSILQDRNNKDSGLLVGGAKIKPYRNRGYKSCTNALCLLWGRDGNYS